MRRRRNGPPIAPPSPGAVDTLRNLGPKSRAWLAEIGLESVADLRRAGAVGAYVRLRFLHPRRVSLNLLYAMEAALRGIDWRELSPQDKAALREALPRSPGDGGPGDRDGCDKGSPAAARGPEARRRPRAASTKS